MHTTSTGDRSSPTGGRGATTTDTAASTPLPPTATDLWRYLAGGAPRHRPVDNSLARVGLAHRRDVRIGRLSGGERRRLELAVALSTDPELAFLDEPTAGLGPESRADTWELIRDLLRCGTTVVLTTHYLEEAEALADRLAILHEGRVARHRWRSSRRARPDWLGRARRRSRARWRAGGGRARRARAGCPHDRGGADGPAHLPLGGTRVSDDCAPIWPPWLG